MVKDKGMRLRVMSEGLFSTCHCRAKHCRTQACQCRQSFRAMQLFALAFSSQAMTKVTAASALFPLRIRSILTLVCCLFLACDIPIASECNYALIVTTRRDHITASKSLSLTAIKSGASDQFNKWLRQTLSACKRQAQKKGIGPRDNRALASQDSCLGVTRFVPSRVQPLAKRQRKIGRRLFRYSD